MYDFSVSGGITQTSLGSGVAVADDTFVNVAVGYQEDNVRLSQDGGAVVTDTNCTIPSVDRMYLGSTFTSVPSKVTVKSLTYYPARLTDAQLQALTS